MLRKWSEVRYRWLLPLARMGRPHGRLYARLVARVEHAADGERNRVAEGRIVRALGVTPGAAATIYRGCLESEAREEADSAFFMRRSGLEPALFHLYGLPERSAAGVGTVYATLHFGSPVFAYLALRCVRGEDVSMIGRPLDEANPMSSAKREYALGKVRWVEAVGARPFLATDAAAMARARDELLAGRSLYTPIDVPGSVVGRAATVQPFDEPVRFAAGLMTLARLAGADVVPVVGLSRGDGFTVHFGTRLAPGGGTSLLEPAIAELARFVRAYPDEWWMWPYLERANLASGAG